MRGLAVDLVLVVGGEQERGHRAGGAGGRLDHVRHVALVGLRVEVVELLAASAAACCVEVVVGALGDALELVQAPREQELDVGRAGRVVRQLVGVVRPQPQHVGAGCRGRRTSRRRSGTSTRTTARSSAGGTKNSSSICSNSRVRKIQFCGVISLRKLLPTWAMPNGGFLRVGLQHVGEVDEHALRRLGAQVGVGAGALDRAGVGLEHQVELAGLGEAAVLRRSSGTCSGRRACRDGSAACSWCSRRAGR